MTVFLISSRRIYRTPSFKILLVHPVLTNVNTVWGNHAAQTLPRGRFASHFVKTLPRADLVTDLSVKAKNSLQSVSSVRPSLSLPSFILYNPSSLTAIHSLRSVPHSVFTLALELTYGKSLTAIHSLRSVPHSVLPRLACRSLFRL